MKFVLDTNTVSMAMAGEPSVTERMFSLARTDVLIPQPVIAEIEYGIARLPESERRQRLVERLQRFIENASDTSWTADVSRAFSTTKADLEARGQRIEDFDVAIAAHALALDAVLVSDNTAHMGRIRGLRLENWRDPDAKWRSAPR